MYIVDIARTALVIWHSTWHNGILCTLPSKRQTIIHKKDQSTNYNALLIRKVKVSHISLASGDSKEIRQDQKVKMVVGASKPNIEKKFNDFCLHPKTLLKTYIFIVSL